MRRASIAMLVVLGFVAPMHTEAHAERCEPIAGGGAALGELDAEARLRYLDRRLAHELLRARAWTFAWTAVFAASSVTSLGLALGLHDREDRINYAFTAGAAAVGLASINVVPLAVLRDQPRLARRLAAPPADRCALLAEAERIFVRDAKSEALSRKPIVHVANFVFNVGVGLGLLLGVHHTNQAMLMTAGGTAVGELMFATQPIGLVRDLERYRTGELGGVERAPVAWALIPTVDADRWGLAAAIGF